MPYKDKVLQREAVKKAVQKHRVLHINKEGITKQGVTLEGITEYHPILEYLIDPIKRDKLERICHSLRQHNQLGEVYFGCRQPLSFDIVEGLLQATS